MKRYVTTGSPKTPSAQRRSARGTVTLVCGKSPKKKCTLLPKPKTSIRDVPMPENLIADLRKYYDWFAEADSQFRSKLDEYYLAVNMYCLPLYPHTVGHWLKTFEEEHHFRYVSCHGLRHTYCSLLLTQNVPIQTVSKYMGHSDSTVTLKVYSHFIPDTQDRVLNALEKLAV